MTEDAFDVRSWLQEIDLGQYEAIFSQNDIESRNVVASLTEDDLEKLGIDSLGHRKRLQAAIEKLRPKEPTPRTPRQKEASTRANSPQTTSQDSGGPWKAVGWLLVILIVIVIISLLGM